MRWVLARWQRNGLTLREFGQQRGIPLSTLSNHDSADECFTDKSGFVGRADLRAI
jgi:hypothetical protein